MINIDGSALYFLRSGRCDHTGGDIDGSALYFLRSGRCDHTVINVHGIEDVFGTGSQCYA
jgi:hypothetical protein